MTLLCGEQVFVLMPAQGAYAGLYKLSTDWHIPWHNPCRAMGAGGSRPEIRCLLRNMKPALSPYVDPAKNKLATERRRHSMNKLAKPNRAPQHSDLFPSSEAFDAMQQVTSELFKPEAPVEFRDALSQLETARTSKSLPRGFSLRNLGVALAESVSARIVSEHEGLIDTLLITVPRDIEKPIDELDQRHYHALFSGLGNHVNYIVLCDPRQNDAIFKTAESAGLSRSNIRIISSPRFNYSIWAQDAYVALNDSSGTQILCEGISFPRGEDMTIADDVAAQSDISVLQSYLYFQGGNVLCTGNRTYVGMDYVMRNVLRYGIGTLDESIAQFAKLFGTDVVPLGGANSGKREWYKKDILSGYGAQPIFHIDMYVTPTGVQGTSGKEIVFLGRPRKAKQITGKYSDVSELNNATYDGFFQETATQLEKHCEVRELPLWITHGNLGYPIAKRYYNLTWNNSILQSSGSTKRVLLPCYSPDALGYNVDKKLREDLEAAVKSEWESIGYTVDWMDGIEDLAFGSGAVHCITKTLKRKA